MSVTVLWRDRAIHEAQEAYDWYEAKSPGLGESLLHELDAHVDSLVDRPNGYPKWRGPYKKINLERFPYLIIFRVVRTTVIIFSVFHSSRNPQPMGPTSLIERRPHAPPHRPRS